MSSAMLVLRVIVGLLFVGHGTQKLAGWFGGSGPDATGQHFEALGYRPGRRHAILAGSVEATSGTLLVLGLATPLAVAGIIGVMVNAIAAVHWPRGLWVTNGGFEYPLVLVAVMVAVAGVGPGRFSLDQALGVGYGARPAGAGWALAALIVGLATGTGMAMSRRAPGPATRTEPDRSGSRSGSR